jgi:tetratricopeptide (TPR) repeat protein
MEREKVEHQPVSVEHQPVSQVAQNAGLQLMLRQGAQWQSAGQFYQALDVYSKVIRDYPDTDAAREAQACLLAIARSFEESGKYHQAVALYRQVAESESQFAEDMEAPRATRREKVLAALAKIPPQPRLVPAEEKHE